MKTLLILSFVIFIESNTFSQHTPEMFLSRIPDPPAAACDMSKDNKATFSNKISELQNQLNEEIETRKEEYAKFAGDNTDKMQQNMAEEMGLSPAELAKFKSGGEISEAEGMALANKAMGQKYNMSVDEAKKLGKMSEAGQKAWAEGYGTEMMADAQANPDKYKEGQAKNKNMFELASEQSKLAHQVQAEGVKFQKQLWELNSKDSIEILNLEKLCTPLFAELRTINDGEGSTAADAARAFNLVSKIYEFQRNYCGVMTPIYLDYLVRLLASVKMFLPIHYRLQEITDQLLTAQTGVEIKDVQPDLMARQSISEYLNLLSSVFRFTPMEKPTRD